jgi:hypothetical protein
MNKHGHVECQRRFATEAGGADIATRETLGMLAKDTSTKKEMSEYHLLQHLDGW